MTAKTGIELQHVQPRLFGTVPPLGLLSAGGLVMLTAIAVLALGEWIAGPLLLVLALALIGLYLVAARHLPSTRLSHSAAAAVSRGRDELRFAGSAAAAWMHAGRRVLPLEREARRLRRERDAVQLELGGAVYRGDEAATARLRERMDELESRLAACSSEVEEAKRVAADRVSRARAPLAPTEIQTKAPARREG